MIDRIEKDTDKAQILLVDDSSASLKLMTTLLTNQGYQVRPASSGPLALRSVAIEAPDLILLDVKMPDMDGYEVCRRLKADAQTRNIPLIFISGLDDVVDKVKGFGAGCVDYITKPFDPEDLLARVETHLQLRRLQKQLEEQNLQLQKEIGERERVEGALQKAHGELEVRVAERTAELAQANAFLRVEVAERKRAQDELRKVNRTLRMLSDCNQTVVRARDERALLQDICRIIVEIGSYEMAWVGFAEQDEEKSIRPVACAGREEGSIEAVRLMWGGPGICRDPMGTAIRTGKPTTCQNMASDQAASPWRVQAVKHNYQSTIAIPLEVNGHVLGALGIYAAEPEVFNPAEVTLLMELAGDLAYGVMTLRTHEDRKRAEEERMRLVTAIEQSAEAIFTVDTHWIIQYANPAFERMSGYSRREIVGQHTRVLKSDKHDKAFYTNIRQTLTAGAVWSGRHTSKRKDGTYYQVEVTGSPVRDSSGEIINYVGIHRDITHEVMLEGELRQAQKMEAIGALAGGIAHDFNNILAAIVGYTEMAHSRVPPGSAVRRNLEQVLKASQRATDLVKQILAFSRQREQERKPLQVGPIVKEVLKLLRSSLPATIEIRQNFVVDPDVCVVMADPTQIHQVLMNLCTNSAHAMRARGGVLNVNLAEVEADEDLVAHHPDLKPGPYARLSVSDTGHGMEAAVMERVFEPYFTTKEVGEGTGLGLAVVQGIVRGYGGVITVRSVPGEGATFDVFLPRIEEEIASGPETVEDLPTGKERILFVDDEETMVVLGKEMLEPLGYRVTASTSSYEALEAFRAHPEAFDLVITDMTMPRLTGSELARELMAIRADIPIILCTGFSELINEKKAQEAGIRAFVMKPYAIAGIAKTIRSVLDQR